MKAISNWCSILLLTLCIGGLVSCDNDDVNLVDTNYKTLEISCGSDFEIPVLVDDWFIEYVRDITSGLDILDKDNNPLTLDENGKVEASNGWLTLSRDNEKSFVISLKENFDKSLERKLLICIQNAGKRDYITLIQHTGSAYQLVKSHYEEIEDLRRIYTSDKECTNIVLKNPLSTEKWEPTGDIFKNVETSIFESEDYGAFEWASKEGVNVTTPDLIINDIIRGGSNLCTYKEGRVTMPYIKDIAKGNKILMPPHSTLYLSGEITYCKRVCNYTFTIQNIGTGTLFEVKGLWTQIIPISSHTTSSDREI